MSEQVPAAEFYQAKAATLRQEIQARHAVPTEMLDALEEANWRELLARVRLALSSLPIGTFALGLLKSALDELRRT